jgi:hypothetical protein
MSITISQQPPAIATALNDIIVEAYENNISSGAAVQVKGRLDIVDFHLLNDWFAITITIAGVATTYRFTCGTEYAVRTTQTLAEWGNVVRDAIAAKALILNNFIISTVSQSTFFRINFEPYIKDGTIAWSLSSSSISGVFDYADSSYSLPVYYNYLRMALQIYIEAQTGIDTTQNERLNENPLILPPVITVSPLRMTGSWNLKEYIKNEYFGHFTFPPTATLKHVWNIIDTYRALVYSEWGSPPEPKNTAFTSEIRVIDANLSEPKIVELNSEGKTISQLLSENKMFLTNAPLIKDTDIYSTEKLNWLFTTSYTGCKLVVKEYYTDGTNNTRTLLTFNASAWQCVEFDVGFQSIKLETYAGLVPTKWEIWLETSAGAFISEIRAYLIDTSYQSFARYWMFKNRWGVYESFRTTGMVKKNKQVKKSYFKRVVENPTYSDKSLNVINETVELKLAVNSGYFTRQWLKYFADEFLQSRDVFWVKNSNKYAVTIADSDPVIEDDNVYVGDFLFTAIVADITDIMYEDFEPVIDLPVAGDFNGDFNNDFLN